MSDAPLPITNHTRQGKSPKTESGLFPYGLPLAQDGGRP
jgi:hypothetical protein